MCIGKNWSKRVHMNVEGAMEMILKCSNTEGCVDGKQHLFITKQGIDSVNLLCEFPH